MTTSYFLSTMLFWNRVRIIGVWLVAAAGATQTGFGQTGGGLAPCACVATLENAINGSYPLTLYLAFDGQECRRSFALAPTFNKPSHLVDASGLARTADRLQGTVKVTVRPDYWTPKDRKPIDCTYTLDVNLSDGKLSGTYRGRSGAQDVNGAAAGAVVPDGLEPKLGVLWLHFFHPRESRERGGHPAVELVVRNGAIVDAQMVDVPSSPTHHGCYDIMEKQALRLDRGLLSGTFLGRETQAGRDVAEFYDAQIDGAVVAGAAGGTLTLKLADNSTAKAPFWGRVEPVVEPPLTECVLELLFHAAAPKNHMVEFRIATRNGRFGRGAGITTVNRGSCEVDATGLQLQGNRITGKVDLVINVDDWMPRDRRPIACSYTIDAQVKDLMIAGAHHGKAGEQEVRGAITGRVRPWPTEQKSRKGYIKLLKGVPGVTGGWVSLGMSITEGGAELTHFPIAAKIESVNFQVMRDALEGTVRCTMQKGPHQDRPMLMEFKGPLVGGWSAGDLKVMVDGKAVADEKFFAVLQ